MKEFSSSADTRSDYFDIGVTFLEGDSVAAIIWQYFYYFVRLIFINIVNLYILVRNGYQIVRI